MRGLAVFGEPRQPTPARVGVARRDPRQAPPGPVPRAPRGKRGARARARGATCSPCGMIRWRSSCVSACLRVILRWGSVRHPCDQASRACSEEPMKIRMLLGSGLAASAVMLAAGAAFSGGPATTTDNRLVDFDQSTGELSGYPAGGSAAHLPAQRRDRSTCRRSRQLRAAGSRASRSPRRGTPR